MTSSLALIRASLQRPYTTALPVLLFTTVVPLYIFIAVFVRERGITYRPELALDRAIPLLPAWTIVYGCLYLTLILLPLFVVRGELHVRRTVYTYLTIWLTAYTIFWIYPTAAPRLSDDVAGDGFAAWCLRLLYDFDPPFNCFPSLHVAHSFASALTIARVHRGVGFAGLGAASLVALSTLFTKQHYVLDIAGGIALALLACALFLRIGAREPVADLDRRATPAFAVGILGFTLVMTLGYWVAYLAGF